MKEEITNMIVYESPTITDKIHNVEMIISQEERMEEARKRQEEEIRSLKEDFIRQQQFMQKSWHEERVTMERQHSADIKRLKAQDKVATAKMQDQIHELATQIKDTEKKVAEEKRVKLMVPFIGDYDPNDGWTQFDENCGVKGLLSAQVSLNSTNSNKHVKYQLHINCMAVGGTYVVEDETCNVYRISAGQKTASILYNSGKPGIRRIWHTNEPFKSRRKKSLWQRFKSLFNQS